MKTIDIRTTQNVTIEYELASLQDRSIAFFIDLMVVTFLYFFVVFFTVSIVGDHILDSVN